MSEALSEGAMMSTVNVAEVVTKLAEDGMDEGSIPRSIGVFGIDLQPFGEADALAAGLLRPATQAFGLSLGDRACLALAMKSGLPALTGDRAWRDLPRLLDIEIEVFR